MGRKHRVKLKGVGGVDIGGHGATVWEGEVAGGRWTFRVGTASGFADLHWSPPDDEKETLWVARTSELLGWVESLVSASGVPEFAVTFLDAITEPVSWTWVRDRGLWVAPMPEHSDAEADRLVREMGRRALEDVVDREPGLAVAPLPLDFAGPLRPGAYLAVPGPAADTGDLSALIWTPGLEGRELLWIDPERAGERARAAFEPYLADLRAMDRPEVRAELAAWLEGRRRP